MPPSSLYSLSLHDALPIFCFRRDYIDTRHKIRSVELCRRTEMIDVHLAGLMKLTGSKMTGKGIGQSQSSSQTRTVGDRKSTRLNSSHVAISYAVICSNKTK